MWNRGTKAWLAVLLFSHVLVDGFVLSALPVPILTSRLRGGSTMVSKGFECPTIELNDGSSISSSLTDR